MKQPFKHFLRFFILALTVAALLIAMAVWHAANSRKPPAPPVNAASDAFLPESAVLNLSTPGGNSEVQFEEKRYELKLDDSVSRMEKELDDWLSNPMSADAPPQAASMPIEAASQERPPYNLRPQPIVPSP